MTSPSVDVITQNVSENIRREQARDLAASVVQAVFRLVKLSTLHSIDNQAMVRQVDETVALVQDFGQRSGHNVSILFSHGSVFVCGQLLKANRGVYEGALELGEILARCGYSEIGIAKDIRASDCFAFVAALAETLRSSRPALSDRPAQRIRLRAVDESVLRREIAIDRVDDETAAVIRAYATAIVIMRRFYEDLRQGRYSLRQGVKRITQRLVDLSANETPAFLGVTALRNQNHDDAGRAVNTAILSLSMARQITSDVVVLQRLAMAALLFDTARPRLTGVAGRSAGGVVPQLGEAQDVDVPAGTAVVLTALGLVNEPSVMRTVVAYEAHWVRRHAKLGALYRGLRQPALQSRILATARAFNDLLTPAPGGTPLSADEAIAKLEQEATDAADRTVLRLLVGALGIFPTGTLVELSTGEVALVVQTPAHPARYSQPRVRLVFDAAGGPIARAIELDLAERSRPGDPVRHIRRIVATSDDPSAASMRTHAATQDASPVQMRSHGIGTQESPSVRPQPATLAPPVVSGVRVPPPPQVIRASSPTLPTTNAPARRPQRSSELGRSTSSPQPAEAGWASTPHDTPPSDLPPPSDGRAPYGRLGRAAIRVPAPPHIEPYPTADSYLPPPEEQGTSWAVQMDPDELPQESVRPHQLSHFTRDEAAHAPPRDDSSDIPPSAKPGPSTVLDLPSNAPTAEGSLARTPLVHLLVYMLDRRLTGTTCFIAPDAIRHGIFFNDGVPAKIWTGTMIAPLDRVIIDLGLLDEATLRETLREITKRRVLHGRLLVARGLLDREAVIGVLRQQLVRKLVALFDLPGETSYAYYDGVNLLSSYGGPELFECEPLAVIMAGIRLNADDPTIDATLDRIANRPLALHLDAEMRRFQLLRDEAAVVDLLRTRRMMLPELIGAGVAQERVVRLTIYALAITRHLDLGIPGRGPVGLGRERAIGLGEQVQVPVRDAVAGVGRVRRSVGTSTPVPRTTRSPSEETPSELPPPMRAGRPVATAAAPRGRTVAPPDRDRSPPYIEVGAAKPLRRESEVAPQDDDVPPPPSRRGVPAADVGMPPRPTAARGAHHGLGAEGGERRPGAPNVNQGIGAEGGERRPGAPNVNQPAAVAMMDARTAGGDAPRAAEPKGPNSPRTLASPGARMSPHQAPTVKMPAVGVDSRALKDAAWSESPPPSSRRGADQVGLLGPGAVSRTAGAAVQGSGKLVAEGSPTRQEVPPNPEIAARRAEIEARAASMDGEDFFELLGVSADAPPDRIQSAYFALAKQWHPDRTPLELQDLKPLIARVFARISEAYQTLSDPKRRADYLKAKTDGSNAADDAETVARVVDAALEFQKAEILLKKNDLPGAELLVRRALLADPEQPEYLALLVWIQAQRRGEPPPTLEGSTCSHYDDLIQTLDSVLRKEPRYERALYYRGVLLKRSGRVDKAIRDFRLAAEINPKNLDAVREVRVHEMRNRTSPEPNPAGGLLGKFFKR